LAKKIGRFRRKIDLKKKTNGEEDEKMEKEQISSRKRRMKGEKRCGRKNFRGKDTQSLIHCMGKKHGLSSRKKSRWRQQKSGGDLCKANVREETACKK